MAETGSQKKARQLASGAQILLEGLPAVFGFAKSDDMVAARELLTMAILLLDGKDEGREKKNAADRERRAKPKTKTWSPPKKKPRPKRPAAGGIVDAL